MAKVMNPLGSTEARGRIGGLIANTWRGISYLKASSSPAQPRSQRQLQIRAWTAMLVRYWGTTLSATNRGYWNDYAVTHTDIDWTGNAKRLSGLNWFVRCNLRLLDLAKPQIDAPPAIAAPNALALFAAADGADQSILTWTNTADWGDYVDIFIQGPHSKGQQPKIERAKHWAYSQGPAGTYTVTPLGPGHYTFWARVTYQDTGLSSPWVMDSCDVT
jgi:hypothetical protein